MFLLDSKSVKNYNIICAEVAQLVEQRTENPRVPSSNLGLGTINNAAMDDLIPAEVAEW